MFTFTHTFVYLCVCVCKYIYVCANTYIYIHGLVSPSQGQIRRFFLYLQGCVLVTDNIPLTRYV